MLRVLLELEFSSEPPFTRHSSDAGARERHCLPFGRPWQEALRPDGCLWAPRQCRRNIEMTPGAQSRDDTPQWRRTRPVRHDTASQPNAGRWRTRSGIDPDVAPAKHVTEAWTALSGDRAPP